MTKISNKSICHAFSLAAVVVLVSACATPCFAWTSETKNKCTGDAFRLCATSIGDDAATEACMQKKSASLSAGCKSAVEKERGAAPAAAAKTK